MEASLSSHLNFATLTQCLFSIVYLSTFQWQRNKWLVLACIIIFQLQLGILMSSSINLSFWHKLIVGNPGTMLWIMPCIYLFTKKLISLKTTRIELLMHFFPGFVFYIIFLITKVYHPQEFILKMSQGEFLFFHSFHLIVFMLSTIYYSHAGLKIIQYNQKKYKNEYAESSIYLTLDWLKYTVWTLTTIILFGTSSILLPVFISNIVLPYEGIALVFLVVIMIISYFAFSQPTLYQSVEEEIFPSAAGEPSETNTTKSLLSTEEIDQLSTDLTLYFSENKPFLELDIRMPDIAKALNISPNKLSWYLNEHHQMNFFAFINQYRIQYSVGLLKNEDYQHYTIEAISKMSGFRSKTTFNNHFKGMIKKTPSSFRKNIS